MWPLIQQRRSAKYSARNGHVQLLHPKVPGLIRLMNFFINVLAIHPVVSARTVQAGLTITDTLVLQNIQVTHVPDSFALSFVGNQNLKNELTLFISLIFPFKTVRKGFTIWLYSAKLFLYETGKNL